MSIWIEKLLRIWRLTARTHLGLIAAGVAFYASFSIFPGIAALIALFGLVADPAVVESELALLRDVMPRDAYVLIGDQVNGLLTAGRTTLGWTTALSLAIAMWSARAGVGALVEGLNAIYATPNRSGFRHLVFSIIMTLLLLVMAVVALGIVFVAPILLAYLPLERSTADLLTVMRWGMAFVLMLAALAVLYRYGPNRRLQKAVFMAPGAVLVIVSWLGASGGLSLYMSNFPNYNQVYGSIGAVVALLLWLYVSAYLVLLGAAFNAVREGHDRAPRPQFLRE